MEVTSNADHDGLQVMEIENSDIYVVTTALGLNGAARTNERAAVFCSTEQIKPSNIRLD